MADTAWMDSLPSVAPTSGMVASGMATAQKANPGGVPTMTIKPEKPADSAWMDALPSVQPTTGMLQAQGKSGAPQSTMRGIARNAAAGATDAAATIGNVATDPIGNMIGKPLATLGVAAHDWLAPMFGGKRFPDDVRNMLLDDNVPQPGNRVVNAVGAAMGAPSPDSVEAHGGAERMARKVVGAAGGAAALSPAGAMLPAAVGAGGAVAGDLAAQTAPDWLKPAAELAGNVAGGAGVAGSAVGLRAGGNLIARKAGEIGIGGKKDFGGVGATGAQANAVGNRLASNIGPEGRQAIERATDAEQQSRALEQTLADPATTPADRQVAQQQLQGIQGRRINLVPGSNPTTAQIAQTAGAAALEKQSRLTHGPEFEEAAKTQNNARVGAIQNLEPTGANPASVGGLFAQRLQQLDQIGQHQIGQAARGRDSAVYASGGTAPIAQYGAKIRETLQSAEDPVHQAASAAFRAVDPNGSWTIQSAPLKDVASKLAIEVSPTAKTDAQTNALLARGMSQPAVIPFSALSQMRADANDGLARLMRTGDAPSEVRRLTLFKQGIDQTIAKAVDDHAAIDPALVTRLHGVIGGQGPAPPVGGVRPGVSGGGGEPSGSGQPVGGYGAGQRGPAGATGADTLAAEAADWVKRGGGPAPASSPPAVPNFGAEEAGKYQSAVTGWRDYMQRYHQGGVGDVLKKSDQGFKVQEGNVAAKIFTGGPTEPAQVAHFIEAIGGPDKAVEIGRNVLANDLRTKGIIKPDGTVDANRLSLWNRNRQGTLQQFPGLANHFASVETAQRTLNDVTATHKAAVEAFNKSAAASFIHDDPLRAVGKAFSSSNPTETFRQLAAGVRGTTAAEAGLKRGVVDYISQRFKSATPSSDGIDFLQPGGFRKWVDTNKGPLRILFGGQGMQDLQMVAADLRRAAEGPKAIAGSQTTPLLANAKRLGASAVSHGGAPVGLSMLALLGEHMGEAATGHGLIGAGLAAGGGMLLNALRQSGIHTMEHLTAEAMLHPQLARTLMERATAQKALSAATQRRIAVALQGALLADMANTGDHRQ